MWHLPVPPRHPLRLPSLSRWGWKIKLYYKQRYRCRFSLQLKAGISTFSRHELLTPSGDRAYSSFITKFSGNCNCWLCGNSTAIMYHYFNVALFVFIHTILIKIPPYSHSFVLQRKELTFHFYHLFVWCQAHNYSQLVLNGQTYHNCIDKVPLGRIFMSDKPTHIQHCILFWLNKRKLWWISWEVLTWLLLINTISDIIDVGKDSRNPKKCSQAGMVTYVCMHIIWVGFDVEILMEWWSQTSILSGQWRK